MFKNLIIILIFALLILSCSKKDKIEVALNEQTIEEEMRLHLMTFRWHKKKNYLVCL